MDAANIQQGIAIYRLPGDDFPSIIAGAVKIMDFQDLENVDISANERFFFRGFAPSMSLRFIDGDFIGSGFEVCESKLAQYFELNPFNEVNEQSTTPIQFEAEVKLIQQNIADGFMHKAVAARTKFHAWSELSDDCRDTRLIWEKFILLCEAYPYAMTFIFHTAEYGYWIGSTPELLFSLDEHDATVMSLAGTLTSHQSNWSDKERMEQSVTSDFIAGVLQQMQISNGLESVVSELKMGDIRHLVSYWTFKLERSAVLPLINQLHPTPAVGGFPQQTAWYWLENHENFDRELYSGFMGISRGKQQKEEVAMDRFYVTLRCAKLGNNGVKFYAGCGINAGSEVLTEWNETEAKIKLICRFFFCE